jgi:hypothetical protein
MKLIIPVAPLLKSLHMAFQLSGSFRCAQIGYLNMRIDLRKERFFD